MAQNHLIGNVSFDFRASRQTDGVALQSEVSVWFWKDVLPELNRVLDEVVPPDVVLKIEQLAITMPLVGKVSWKEKLTVSLCQTIAEEITRRRLFPRPTDAPIEELSPKANQFAAWLEFIRTGQQQLSIADPAEWQMATLGLIATSARALQTLRQVLQTNTMAIERLVRQHDEPFLGQLAEAMTGYPALELLQWRAAFQGLFLDRKWQIILGIDAGKTEELAVAFWTLVVEMLCGNNAPVAYNQWISRPQFFQALIERLTKRTLTSTQLTITIARFFSKPVPLDVKRQASKRKPKMPQPFSLSEQELQRAVVDSLQQLPEHEQLIKLLGTILQQNRPTIAAFLAQESFTSATKTEIDRVPETADSVELSDEQPVWQDTTSPAEGDVFYVQNAGLVLLHPFLSAFFKEIGLMRSNESAHRRAVQVLHFLATGETNTPEYALLLPKILAGWPIEKPIDLRLKLTKAEKAEVQSLLEMIISYWSVLGSTSVDGLREGFLRRDGRLSKRDNGWLLQVETQTLDILLDQLPWGIGVIKNDWMTDFLYVEWY